MGRVVLTPAAQKQMAALPGGMIRRINEVLSRLQRWPDVSGAKPLQRNLKGNHRIRCGDWRVLFRVEGETVIVWAVDNRRDVYER